MKHILRSIFSVCLVFSMFFSQAQENIGTPLKAENILPAKPKQEIEKLPKKKETDSIVPKINRYGLRVGADLYKLTRGFYDSNYKGIELVGDYRLTKKYYLAAELGSENKTTEDDRLTSTAKGTYVKAGFDYNVYENWLDMENIISIGMRAGFSTFSQQLNSYKIYNPNPYWGEVPPIISGKNYSGLSASWIEVVAGIKAKVFNNVFVGFSIRLNRIITNKEPNGFENLYIPGFNRTYDGDFGVGFNYTVSYFIPIFKKKILPPNANEKQLKK
ncbi:DUF6048 family protein [Flavobacterium sp. TSSA_36]|uniref:DUF6048 family protein n=1 Tax=Flavobacterium sp. TSSA_36 TaxID=3447669 RepID=UPI003F3663AD